MKSNFDRFLRIMALAVCLCTLWGCQSGRPIHPTAEFIDLPPETTELGDEEVPPAEWSPPIKALKPIKVYRYGGNLAVVQKIADGVESGKYIIGPTSSKGPAGRFIKFTPVVMDGFPFPTSVFDYQRPRP